MSLSFQLLSRLPPTLERTAHTFCLKTSLFTKCSPGAPHSRVKPSRPSLWIPLPTYPIGDSPALVGGLSTNQDSRLCVSAPRDIKAWDPSSPKKHGIQTLQHINPLTQQSGLLKAMRLQSRRPCVFSELHLNTSSLAPTSVGSSPQFNLPANHSSTDGQQGLMKHPKEDASPPLGALLPCNWTHLYD